MEPRSDDHRAFGLAIRELRKQRGLTQEDLAHASGLDRSYMGGIERGEHNLSLTNILRVGEALDLSPSELFLRFETVRERDSPG
jgi:transcriptional regulator with XRE-family HTH domain